MENVITNAQTAAASPANNPPAPDAAALRIKEINAEPDFWSDGPKTRGLREEMKRLAADPAALAKQDQANADAAALSPSEQRRQQLTRELVTNTKLTDAERAAKTRELKALVASLATPEEQQAMKEAPLEDHRSAFGLHDPDERVLPKAWVAEYTENYGGHESDFLLAARQHGLESKLVGELRDAGIRRAVEAEGRSVSDEAWSAVEKRFAGRLTAKQFTSLRAWWRASVEGGAS